MGNGYIIIPAITGLLASLYAFHVKRKLHIDKNYKPVCDISKAISCSRAFNSPSSQIFPIPNALLGVLYYLVILLMVFFEMDSHVLIVLTIPAALFSIYLAYISYFKQKNFCLVCSFSYLINFLLLYFSICMS